jgi:hypothetical protein
MPFELGLAVTWAKLNPERHSWIVFATKALRLKRSLSDLNAIDVIPHDDRVAGVLKALCMYFQRPDNQPKVPDMMKTYRIVSRQLRRIATDRGAENLFKPRAFRELCYATRIAVEKSRIRS